MLRTESDTGGRQIDGTDATDGRTDDAEVDRRTCGRSLLSTCEEERGESGLLNGVVAGERDAQRVALGRDRLRRLRPAVGAVQARLLLVEPRPNLHRIVLAVLLHTRYDTRCYFNVRSKADISQLNLPHGTDN